MIRKLFITSIASLLIIMALPICNSFSNRLSSEEYYPIACNVNEFEVSYIEDNGSLTKVSCHSNYGDAKNAMKANADYVVRYDKSFSPTKIVAMNSGLAYTYPGRGGSSTMNLYQNYEVQKENYRSNAYKYTYLTNHYEMTYIDTVDASASSITENGKGFVKIIMYGFEGYADLQYVDLVPQKYITNNIAIYLGGKNIYETDEGPFEVKLKQSYYSLEDNGNYTDLVFHYYRGYPVSGSVDCYSSKIRVDNAINYLNAGMKKNIKYYSPDGIVFYEDAALKKPVCKVYGYYQYLSMRTKTSIPASTFDNFLNVTEDRKSQLTNQGQAFINAQNNYGSNALVIYAMACLESGYGTSGYAINRNNLFGWSAYDSDPNNASSYSSIEECVNYQMGQNLDWFMDHSNWRYNGTCVGNKGTGFSVSYSSDPYWGAKIAAISYSIDKFNNNNNGKLTDHNKYAIGFVKDNYNDCFYDQNTNNWDVNVYASPYDNNVLYTTKFATHYQKDLIVAIDERIGNRYKIHLPNPVVDGKLYYDSPIIGYDWDSSVGYIDCENVLLMNNTNIPSEMSQAEGFVSLRSASLQNNKLTITGVGGIKGVNFSTSNKEIVHQVIFNDANNSENKYVFTANNIDSNGYSLNDGYDYTLTGFSLEIDISDNVLPQGSYYVTLKTINGKLYSDATLRNSNDKFANILSNDKDYFYRFTTNSLYNYRLEFDKYKSELNYHEINKPSSRTSLVSIDDISINESGLLSIKAHGMIYYLNYNNKTKLQYDVYLLKEDGSYIKMDTNLIDNAMDYKTAFNSSYNMDNISFLATTDLFNVEGNYNIILRIKNDNYIDYVEFVNRSHMPMPSVKTNELDIQILTSNIRNRLYITCVK